MNVEILHEDDDLVAVDKAPGVLCDATRDPRRDHLGAALARRLGQADAVHPAHRLDRETSGVVVFARHREAATSLMHQFQQRQVTKHYQAVVLLEQADWQVGATFERRSHLRHRKGRTEEVTSGGKVAETHFEVTEVAPPVALVAAWPRTGRTHQLRVHFAALGAPILGDARYGDPDHREPRLWLHARRLELAHPRTDRPLDIVSRRSLALSGAAPVEVQVRSRG